MWPTIHSTSCSTRPFGSRSRATSYTTPTTSASSQGVFQGAFISLNPEITSLGGTHDFCKPSSDGIFDVLIGGVKRQVRKVEPRNTPTMINAAFFDRNFWDGRANNVFNGVDPFGNRDVAARIFAPAVADYSRKAAGASEQQPGLAGRRTSWQRLRDGLQRPQFRLHWPEDVFPRSGACRPEDCADRQRARPLRQTGADQRGLIYNYRQLVQNAFQDNLWNVPGTFGDGATPDTPPPVDPAGFTQDEKNFSLFWGLAIEAYERTLISDKAPIDNGTLGDDAKRGFDIFVGQGKCVACHVGPLFSGAAVPPRQPEERVERMIMGNNEVAFYDGGFYNIGVRPTQNDVGVGDVDPFGNPLSFTRQHVSHQKVDPFDIVPEKFDVPCTSGDCTANARVAVDGAFKTPSLRNVALTPPYFHNGGEKSLADVVKFYNRGGNRCGQDGNDTTGTGPLGQTFPPFKDQCKNVLPAGRGSNLDADIQVLGLTDAQQADLVAFLKALTDPRVSCHKAPFDHPELIVPNGHKLTAAGTRAADARLRVREVGKDGYAASVCAPNSGDLFAYHTAPTNLIGVGKIAEVLP